MSEQISLLADSLELIRQSLCPYPGETCDCKFGIRDLPGSGHDGEQTGCPELRHAVVVLHELEAENDYLHLIADVAFRARDLLLNETVPDPRSAEWLELRDAFASSLGAMADRASQAGDFAREAATHARAAVSQSQEVLDV